MRICIDSCIFIHAAQHKKSAERRLITISDNRRFLRELHADAFEVLDAQAFVARWERDAL